MKTLAPLSTTTVVAAAIDAVGTDGAPVRRVKLLPLGKIVLNDGRGPFFIDDRAHAERIVASSLDIGGRQLPIDYDHQLIYAVQPGQGGTAIASGWMESISVDDTGIWADVAWTAAAAARLTAREYRYISPVFNFDPATKRVTKLRTAGLVNIPAIDALPAVASSQLETTMNPKIAQALGLPETATEDDILAAIAGMTGGKLDPAVAVAAASLGLAATATVGEIAAAAVAAAAAAEPDPKRFVPVGELQAVTAKLATINAGRADLAVASAIAAGKLVPAQAARMKKLFERDEADFNEWEASAPVIVAAGAIVAETTPKFDGTAATLDDGELAVCRSMGLTAEAFAAAKPKDA